MEWTSKVYNWLNNNLSVESCVLCARPGPSLCGACRHDLPRLDAACARCAAPLGLAESALGYCGSCLRRPPAFDGARALFRYQQPVSALIQDLKFGGRLRLAALLGGMLAEAVAGDPRPDLLVPVPLHPRRLRQRGFNQALVLAHPLAARLEIPLASAACARIRMTDVQSELPLAARRGNVRGAFAATELVRGKSIALVDDVITTGSTAAEITAALKRAGAMRVVVWAIARA